MLEGGFKCGLCGPDVTLSDIIYGSIRAYPESDTVEHVNPIFRRIMHRSATTSEIGKMQGVYRGGSAH